jgi:bifunctional non-homologous end joining protein LigD
MFIQAEHVRGRSIGSVSGAPYLPMLATAGSLPAGPTWAYELKWDGIRAVAVCRNGTTRLYARKGNEVTVAYPELADLGAPFTDAVFDGEIVVFNADGRPSFRDVAERMHVRDANRAARLRITYPVTYLIFDLLRLDGTDLTDTPYAQRRRLLEELAPAGDRWMVPPSFDDGQATVGASREHGLEGVVAKRKSSVYRPGLRTPDWVKVKSDREADFVVGGWRPGARTIGGLLVGVPSPAGLVYRGRVGGGISNSGERDLLAVLGPLVVESSPFAGAIPREDAKTAVWVRPDTVVQVKFSERTRDGRLRFPRFVRLRPDKSPDEVDDE